MQYTPAATSTIVVGIPRRRSNYIRAITFLFTRLTRTDGSALGLMHRRPGARFAPVERHRVVAHSGPFLLPFAAPGTAFGPL